MLADPPKEPDTFETHEVNTAATSGAKSMGVRVAVSMLIALVSKPILGRLIGPEETGIFNAATGLTGPLQQVGEGFLGGSLVQQQESPTDDDYTTVITLQILFATITSLGLVALAPTLLRHQQFQRNPKLVREIEKSVASQKASLA